MRIGHGFDVHALVAGRPLILGGVEISHASGLQGHSDADVLLHAICDACLGAAGLGDIGQHFPDTDPSFKDADSRSLLRHVLGLLGEHDLSVMNVDSTIIAQAPRLAGHIPQMRQNIAEDLGLEPSAINVKATTTEGLGYEGRQEGISAHAVVLLDALG